LTPGASKTVQPFRNGLISMIVIAIRLVFFKTSISVHLNMSERQNGQLTLAKYATELAQMFWGAIKTLAVMLEELVHITDLSVVKVVLGWWGKSCLASRDFSSLTTHFRTTYFN
jgi:hypothetical protein